MLFKFNKFYILMLWVGILCSLALEGTELRVAQYLSAKETAYRNYPDALPSLLQSAREYSGMPIVAEPLLVSSFQDPRLESCPLLYVNWDDSQNWSSLPEVEVLALRKYLQSGGYVLVDAGISAEFLRNSERVLSQHHSYGEWQEAPAVRDFFLRVLPENHFQPLGRDDPIYACFYQGLPDAERLPPTVKEYTMREKWPNGTYSAVGIRLQGRLAVLATPVIAMGWGRNAVGGWSTVIRMRVLEDEEGLNRLLPSAPSLGAKFDARREDGGMDHIYCQNDSLPAWLHEPTGRWRVFQYYDSNQISDYTHIFYTRLGINYLIAALLGE